MILANQHVAALLRTAALALCLVGALGCGAAAEDAAPSPVDELVAQGTALPELDDAALQALLAQAQEAAKTADATDITRLENLEAAVTDLLAAKAALQNGTLDELAPSAENSWRYQNGTLVVTEDDDDDGEISLASYNAGGDVHYGIDVSYYQGYIDWDAVKASGIEFAYLRCGIGSEYDGIGENKQDDAQWARNASECERLGIPYGAYLFSYATNTDMAASEARHTLSLLAGHSPQLPIFLDMEHNRQALISSEARGAIAQLWCDAVQGTGYKVGIYANQNWWYHYLTADNFNNDSWYRWVACYDHLSYTGRMDARQYSCEGSVPGISGEVDMNYWYGDLPSGGSSTPTPTPRPGASREAAEAFATRLYLYCLDRAPDPDGLNNWATGLQTGAITGSGAAYGFVFSSEFKAKNYCNTDFIKYMYRVFLDREYDPAGLASWVSTMASGATREQVFNGFAGSAEFSGLCAANGIVVGDAVALPAYGTVPTGPCSVCGEKDGVTLFVTRLYNVCLDREPETAGLASWCHQLWGHSLSGRDAAFGFLFSDEFTGKNYDNGKYVDYLYRAMMGREADAPGRANWVSKLAAGASRQEIFEGFVVSAEFTEICNRYGIVRG